jgi:heme/copper-type cytochrome/quinol oxidase subunit 2
MRASVLVFVACAGAALVAHLAILASVLRQSPDAADPGVRRPSRAAEIIWALVPLVALAFVLTATWDRVRDREERPTEVMKVAR